MTKRSIIRIDEYKCTGCGQCIPNCPEGALQIIEGKARLVSDLCCDGLGACIGHCPFGAITVEEREAQPYNERMVMDNVVAQGANVIKAHLEHLRDHKQDLYLREAINYLNEKNIPVPLSGSACGGHGGCPGAAVRDMRRKDEQKPVLASHSGPSQQAVSQLQQWPVQLMLVPPAAPFFQGADLLISADCVPFAYADFHSGLLKNKVLLVGCPKLDDTAVYEERFEQIFSHNDVSSVTYARMEVPCCYGMVPAIQHAIARSGKKIPLKEVIISIKGERIQ